jgi:hypothetical protein
MVRPRQARPSAARAATILIAAAALVLLAAACSDSPSSTGAGGSSSAGAAASSPSAVAYSRCMRSHGVPAFPDPGSSGIPKVSPQQLGVASSRWQAAQSACAQLLRPTQDQARQILTGMLYFARCMRSHGVPDWPDPTAGSNGQAEFDIPGIDPDSPRISNTASECTHLLVQSATGPTTVELCAGVGEDGECHGYGQPPNG